MTIIIIIIIIIYTFLSLRLVSLVFKHVRFCVDEMCLRRINMSLKEIYIFIFFQACERAESSNSCNVIGSESGRFFTILPANPGGIVGSFIHKFVCCLWMSKNRHFQTIFLSKLALLGKSEFYHSVKKSEWRIKKVSQENRQSKAKQWHCKYYNLAFMHRLLDIYALFVVLFPIFFCMNLNSAVFHWILPR